MKFKMQSVTKLAEEQWKSELAVLMKIISDHNLYRRQIERRDYAFLAKPPENIVKALLKHDFFLADTREWDGRSSRTVRINEYEINCISSDPYTLVSVPDEEKIYLRFHPSEHTHKGDERIPSRDFLLSSYPWGNVYLASTLEENSTVWAKVVRDAVSDEINSKDSFSFNSKYDVEVGYFGLEKDTSAGFREVISNKEFERLISDNSRMASALAERGFSGFAYKLVKREDKFGSNHLIKKSKPRNFIVFIDSLDLEIVNQSSFYKGLTAIPEIISSSIVYKNFTASGDWTYPCLYSLHTGTLPQFNFSNFRHDPAIRLLNRECLGWESVNQNMANFYNTRSLFLPGSKIDSKDFLTRKIAEAGFTQAGIKSSRNHGWRCGLTHSLDISFENCSISQIPDHLNRLIADGNGINIDTFFIDIDCLHRNDMFSRKNGQYWNVDHSEWIQETPDKYERLLGVYQDIDVEQRRYKDKILKVDEILSSILEVANPDDNILIFSDHGTQYFPWAHEDPYEKGMDSTLSPERIWKPTLLVYAPTIPSYNGYMESNELVSTSDLYNIILKLHGIAMTESIDQSILPESLGGKKNRQIATTFGLTVEANEEHPELSLPNRFELVVRYSHDKGELFQCPAFPLIESQSLEELNHKMFPTLY